MLQYQIASQVWMKEIEAKWGYIEMSLLPSRMNRRANTKKMKNIKQANAFLKINLGKPIKPI